MVVQEIKATLEFDDVVQMTGSESPVLLLTKRIELQEGKRHTLMSVDFMDDVFEGLYEGSLFGYEVYVSPFPINTTNMNFAGEMLNRGPAGGDNQVLFKRSVFYSGSTSNALVQQQLPNNFLGSMPTASWYTPHLYISVLIHVPSAAVRALIDPCYSFYMSVDSKKADTVSYLMGAMGEYMDAHTRLREANGVVIVEPDLTYQGYTFPMWKYGGIRPEFMARGTPSFMNFFQSTADAEKMLDPTNLEIFIQLARNMVPFDQAFGLAGTVKGPVPDWIRFDIDVGGIEYGLVRPQFPPQLKNTDGTTQMV